MHLLLLAFCAFALCLAAPVPPPTATYYYTQTLDHFNFLTEPQTFQQRVLVYDADWDKANNGPVFFYAGNEGDIRNFYDNTGFMFDIAPEFGALIIFAEHRFYGHTQPFGNKSHSVPQIGLLSIEQALADYAEIIPAYKKLLGAENSKVISFGGSYGGMLAAYLRFKFPHIVDGALAASAPIRLFSGYTMAPGFYETVSTVFARRNPECTDNVKEGFAEFLKLAAQGPAGWKTLTDTLRVCRPITSQHDVAHVLAWLVNSYANMAMANYPYPANFLGNLPAWPLDYSCTLTKGKAPLEGLRDSAGLFYNGTNGALKCYDTISEYIECSDQTGCGEGPDGHSWDYQACTEIIALISTNNVTDMFPPHDWTLADLQAHCKTNWGVAPRPGWMGTNFGGPMFKGGSNIIFSNGLLDPWHGGGFLKQLSPTMPAVLIKDGAHHLDLRSSNPLDPQSVITARNTEKQWIKKFLEEKAPDMFEGTDQTTIYTN